MHSSWSIFKINNPPSRHTDLMTTVIWFPPRSISPMINRIARIWNPPADRRATASSSSRDLETNRMQFGANCCILFHCWGAMTWQKKKNKRKSSTHRVRKEACCWIARIPPIYDDDGESQKVGWWWGARCQKKRHKQKLVYHPAIRCVIWIHHETRRGSKAKLLREDSGGILEEILF